MRRVLMGCLLLLASCDAIDVGSRTPSPREEPPAEESAVEQSVDARACVELTRGECARALHCTLEARAGGRPEAYVCRDARGNCEVGLRQIEDDRDRCADRIGCAWSAASCYCPCRGMGHTAVPDGDEAEACDCECGGGPPPGCRAR